MMDERGLHTAESPGFVWVSGPCFRCGRPCTVRRRASDPRLKYRRYCRPECLIADRKEERRAHRRGAPWEPISRWRLFEAAGWACWICGSTISPHLPCDHPLKATVDHIRPFGASPPGGHTADNVRACCNRCNHDKDDQLVEVAA